MHGSCSQVSTALFYTVPFYFHLIRQNRFMGNFYFFWQKRKCITGD